MRLERGVAVAGVDPQVARALARACHHNWSPASWISEHAKVDPDAVVALLQRLADGGYLQHRPAELYPEEGLEWNTTLAGGALTMASFLKPIPRAKAELLLAGVLERAAAYNGDDAKPLLVARLVVFGSYLDPDVADLGDLDLGLTTRRRRNDEASVQALLRYGARSGRTFSNYTQQLCWPETEVLQILKNRSPYINITTENLTRLTDRQQTVLELPDPT